MRFLTGIKRRKYGLKKKLRKEWLAISVHSSERLYPPSFDEKGGYVDRIIGGIVPMKLVSNGELRLLKNITNQGTGYTTQTDILTTWNL
jgi:hypothetical protein